MTPYGTWVSEIMLQQTRVEAVVDYWTRWMAKFPTVASLAAASEDEVVASWAGLGFYRRARNLLRGAQTVVSKFGGVVPSTVPQLLELEGVGEYTAGAIASIAYGQPVPLVDGNVVRVFSRLRAAAHDAKSPALAKACWAAAKGLVDPSRPGDFNQALMELGATICTPQSPLCGVCPLRVTGACRGYAAGLAALRDGTIDSDASSAVDIEDAAGGSSGSGKKGGGSGSPAKAKPQPKQASLLGFFKKAASASPEGDSSVAGAAGAASSSSGDGSSASSDGASLSADDFAKIGRYVAERYPLKAAKKASPIESVAVAVIHADSLPSSALAATNDYEGASDAPLFEGPWYLLVRNNGKLAAAAAAKEPAAGGERRVKVGTAKFPKEGAALPPGKEEKASALLEKQWQPVSVSLGRRPAASSAAGDDEDEADGEEDREQDGGSPKKKARKQPAKAKGKAAGSSSSSSSSAVSTTSPREALLAAVRAQLGVSVEISSLSDSSSASSSSSSSSSLVASASPAGCLTHVFSHVTHDISVESWAVNCAAAATVAPSSPGGGISSLPSFSPPPGWEARWVRPSDFPSLGLTTWACKALYPVLIGAARTALGEEPFIKAYQGLHPSDATLRSIAALRRGAYYKADVAGWAWMLDRWAKAKCGSAATAAASTGASAS